MPIWVATPYFLAAAIRSSHSSNVWARGFSVKTGSPRFIAAMRAGKCEKSGFITATASILPSIASSIRRKSVKRGASGYFWSAPAHWRPSRSVSHRALTTASPDFSNSCMSFQAWLPMPTHARRTLPSGEASAARQGM